MVMTKNWIIFYKGWSNSSLSWVFASIFSDRGIILKGYDAIRYCPVLCSAHLSRVSNTCDYFVQSNSYAFLERIFNEEQCKHTV